MRIKKFVAAALAVTMGLLVLVGCTETMADVEQEAQETQETQEDADEVVVADVDYDWANFTIDPSLIPQEKLDTTVYLAVSVRGLENPYYITIVDGVEMFTAFLDSIGQQYELQLLDSGGSNDVEINNMRQFLARAGENAIIYADANESATVPALASAVEGAGALLATVWNRPEDVGPDAFNDNWVIHTTADNQTAGRETAIALFESMGGEGQVFVVEGMLGNTAAIDRLVGFEEALEQFPGIEVAAQGTANWDTSEALRLVETWLTATPDVGGIWCANDSMATGALQALTARGLEGTVGVTGIDANEDIVEAVKNGLVVATYSSNAYAQGSFSFAVLYAVWAGLIEIDELPSEFRDFFTVGILVLEGNAEEYMGTAPDFDFTRIFDFKAD
ncbi:MAG: sugar ABC transporter substrate-binding protein [Lachnospiraceae bacterium]|nr:sugar ABC transporter substrate-binding protein [Lachnospiraceae bacterium]